MALTGGPVAIWLPLLIGGSCLHHYYKGCLVLLRIGLILVYSIFESLLDFLLRDLG